MVQRAVSSKVGWRARCLAIGVAVAVAGALLVLGGPGRAGAVTSEAFVRSSGGSLVDPTNPNGPPLKLRGVNLGGVLQWEGWIWGMYSWQYWYGSETDIINRLAEKIPMSEVDQFRKDVYQKGITAGDFQKIHDLGFNSVRLPINHRVLEDDSNPGAYKPEGWARLDAIIADAKAAGLYVVLDMHSAPGGQRDFFTADPNPAGNQLWGETGEANRVRTVNLWGAIAARYKDETAIAGYDLLNEPEPPSNAELLALYQRIITAVRASDTNHLVILEGKNSSGDLTPLLDAGHPTDSKMMYSFHQYRWLAPDSRRDMQEWVNSAVAVANAHNVPLWAGEFGEDNVSDIDRTVAMYEDPANGVDGWSYWTWKKVAGTYPALQRIDPLPSWSPVLGWLNRNWGNNASPTQIRQGLSDLLLRLDSSTLVPNPDLIAALQPHSRPDSLAWRSPTANWTDAWCGGNGWEVAPANAYADDGIFARNDPAGVGQCQQFYNYGISIPTGTPIKGIEVRIDAKVNSTAGSPSLQVSLSPNAGSSWTKTRSIPIASTGERTDILGWSTDLWDTTWNTGQLSNANFRVSVKATCATSGGCASTAYSLDWVAVRIYT